MKKLTFLILMATFCKAQSVVIEPNQIHKTEKNANASEDILLTSLENRTPTIVGRRANTSGLLPMLTPITLDNTLFSIGAKGYVVGGFSPNLSSSIDFKSTQDWTPTALGSQIRFKTTPNGSNTSQDRLVIDNNGNVGIGLNPLNPPTSRLHIENGNSGVSSAATLHVESSTNNYLTVSAPDNFATGIILKRPSNEAQIYFGAANVGLGFYIDGTNRLSIANSNGNVGIGTVINAVTKLQVNGDLALNKMTINTTGNAMEGISRDGASIIKFSAGGDLYGIESGVTGSILYIFNTGTNDLIIHDNSALSNALNQRILTNGVPGSTITIAGRGGATLIYDGESSRWRVVSVAL